MACRLYYRVVEQARDKEIDQTEFSSDVTADCSAV